MVTQNLRFACFIAKASDRGLAVEQALKPTPFGEANVRRVDITDEYGGCVEALLLEFRDGSYELFLAQSSPIIDHDVDHVKALLAGKHLIHARESAED